MRRFAFLSIIFTLILVSFVSAVGDVNIASVNSPSGNPGSTAQVNVVVENAVAGLDIPTVVLTSSDLTFSGNTILAPDVSDISNLANSTPQTVSFSITIPSSLAGPYSGIITAAESGNEAANNHTFPYSVTINSFNALDVTSHSETDSLIVTGEEDSIRTATFNVKNTGSNTFTLTSGSFNFTSNDFTDNDGENITLSFSNLDSSVTPGATDTVTLTVNIPNRIDLDNYDGIITVQNPNDNTKTDTFLLDIRIQPEVCSDGIVRDGDQTSSSQAWLQIDINDPDDGDEYNLGDTISLDVTIGNENDDPIDVVVEAFLYDMDDNDEIVSVESDSLEIDEDDEDDFDLDLIIPRDSSLDEDHEYVLFVKAYEDGDEDENCNEDSIEIDIEKEDDDVIVDNVLVNPNTVSCGETVEVVFDVENIGARDQNDIIAQLRSSELNVDMDSNEFDLDRDDDVEKRFTFSVPTNARAGTYSLEVIAEFDDGDKRYSEFSDLVVECGGQTETPTTGSSASLDINEQDIVISGNSFSIPLKITNNAGERSTYTVEVDADWANPVSPRTLTLNDGQTSTIFVLLEAKEGEAGRRSAVINVESNNDVVASRSLAFDLEGESSWLDSFNLGSLSDSTVFWIIADIVAIIAVLYILKLIFLPKK
ncbi:putative S-layer protein [Candidatus Woesearchaeota archaeon]|nr:putative S-layer protein [Candidatus Woesearchaeota archaeon]